MTIISLFFLSLIHFTFEKRAQIELSGVSSTLNFFLNKVHSFTGEKRHFSNEYFNITISNLDILIDIGTPILNENTKIIRYDNVAFTYSFSMRIKEKDDQEDYLSITRSDCIAVQKYENIIFTLKEDNELTFKTNRKENQFEISDLDLFHLELFKDNITKKDSSIESFFNNITNNLISNISTIYPECDQVYYFKMMLTELIQYGYFSMKDIKSSIQVIRFLNVTSYEIRNKEFYNITLTVWLETNNGSMIIPLTIEHFILKQRGFNIVGDIKIEKSIPLDRGSVKNAIYYCIFIVHKTLDWE